MANTVIALKKSATPSATPTGLANGELAINFADGKLFYKHANGSIIAFNTSGGNSFGTVNANGTLVVADTASAVLTLVAGNNIQIVGDPINDIITISATSGGTADVGPAFDKANAANLLAYNVGINANAYLISVIAGANAAVGTGANAWSNTKLSNSTGTFAGTLTITGNTITTNVIVNGGIQTAANGNYGTSGQVLTTNGSATYWQTLAAGGAAISDTPPGSPTNGSLWWSSTFGSLYIYYNDGTSSQWVETTPGAIFANAVQLIASNAFDKANAANLLAFNTGIGANNYLLTTLSGANTAVGTGANTISTSAFAKANAALANTTGTFAGTLTITGNTITTNVIVNGGIQTAANGNYGTAGQILTSNGVAAYWQSLSVSAFPSGTAMLFAQTAAPTGWTKSTTHNDKALRVVSGTASNGGSVAFSTAFASQAVSGTVGSTTLSTTQIPSHTHGNGMSAGAGGGVSCAGSLGASASTGAAGGGGSHNHTFSGTAINLAVNYVDVIIATKD